MSKGQARDLFMAKAQGLVTEREVYVEWLRMGYASLVDWETGEVLVRVVA